MSLNKVNKTVKVDIKDTLKSALPQVFEDGKINFSKLKSLLGGETVDGEDDRFFFNWAGKSGLFKLIQASAYGALKPEKKKSVDFDKTQNLMIVGENLETLKLLLKPYFGQVKMIYIDPLYNKDGDRIYADNFEQPLRDYLERTGQITSEGEKLTTSTESNGRYHSDWLNFIYPRLFLARSLLKEDGVIFVSIDDCEVHHLRMVMDEIFGGENFEGMVCWRRRHNQPNDKTKMIAKVAEFIVVYAKNSQFLKEAATFNGLPLTEKRKKEYSNPDNDSRGLWSSKPWKAGSNQTGVRYKIKTPAGKVYDEEWLGTEETFKQLLKDNRMFFPDKGNGLPRKKYFLNEREEEGAMVNNFWNHAEFGSNQEATAELAQIFSGKNVFDNPKPVRLLKSILNMSTFKDDIILDFFSGSGTSGQAVWDLNKEDDGQRKFILVQLDEPVDEKAECGKNALSLGLKTVSDICVERLKRVSDDYRKQKTLFGEQDFGFKVFKLEKSNFNLKDEFEINGDEDAKELKNKYLEWLGIWINEPLVSGHKPIDVVYEVLLKEGFDLNSIIEELKIKTNDFWHVKDQKTGQEFYISLDEKINKATIEEIRTPTYKGKTFVLLDKALSDNDKINLKAFVRTKVI